MINSGIGWMITVHYFRQNTMLFTTPLSIVAILSQNVVYKYLVEKMIKGWAKVVRTCHFIVTTRLSLYITIYDKSVLQKMLQHKVLK